MTGQIAEALGWPHEEVELIRRAAPLHDVGKIAIPDSILLKPGKLTAEEFEQMKTHTVLGAKMLSGGQFPLLQLAEQIALTHHERWDGNGYIGLCEEAIPMAGRIVTVADVFDALTSKRPYKEAWTVSAAIEEIQRQSGRQFDPCVVDAFLKVVQQEPTPLPI
jgi:putative two-component system response regulator